MRVLQLIDSLRPGGAEKMAVNIANALLPHVRGSYLCCTRQEGLLRNEIQPEVGYIFLNKKSSLDPNAILKLRKFIRENGIEIVHAHSTSYFLGGLLKLSGSRFKLIWHDHYGDSEFLEKRRFKILKLFSHGFDGIISVNTALREWAINNLSCKLVVEIKNFIPETRSISIAKEKLKGHEEAFKIICVANLRPQKDHLTLLKAFELLNFEYSVTTLHLVGEDPGTTYAKSVLSAIKYSPARENIFYYGVHQEILSLLRQADVGILSSRSEGLPLALLEYGLAGLAVIATDVGQCKEVIKDNGIIVDVGDSEALFEGIKKFFLSTDLLQELGDKFQRLVKEEYSEMNSVRKICEVYKY